MSDQFRDRIKILEQEINKCVSNVGSVTTKSCIPSLVIIGSLVPVIVAFILYFLKPSMVTREDDHGEKIRCTKKLLLWIVLITLVCWGGLYGLTYIEAFNTGLTCMFY